METLRQATFTTDDGSLVIIENPAVLVTLLESGVLSRSCAPSARQHGPVLVTLDTEEADFVLESAGSYDDGDRAFAAFLQTTHLTTPARGGLTLADARPLYRLLAETTSTVRDALPTVPRRDFVERYHRQLAGALPRWEPPALTPHARGALRWPHGTGAATSLCGVLSVCPRDHEPACYSTYTWIEDDVCRVLAIYNGELALELFPFRLTR